jgi:hypothetical protein
MKSASKPVSCLNSDRLAKLWEIGDERKVHSARYTERNILDRINRIDRIK